MNTIYLVLVSLSEAVPKNFELTAYLVLLNSSWMYFVFKVSFYSRNLQPKPYTPILRLRLSCSGALMANLWFPYMAGHGDIEECTHAWQIQIICLKKTRACRVPSFARSMSHSAGRHMETYVLPSHYLINVHLSVS